jgi:hypothetical protein
MRIIQPASDSAARELAVGSSNRAKRRAEITAALVYAAGSVCLFLYSGLNFSWLSGPYNVNLYEAIALAGDVTLSIASICLLIKSRFTGRIAFLGALLNWPFYRFIEFNGANFSSWLFFNLPDEGQESHAAMFLVTLKIVSISLLFAATAFSAWRLMPASWRVRKLSLRDRVWPASAISFLLVASWFLASVSRYEIPIFDLHSNPPMLSVLHVEKRGLQFHETSLAFYRNGEFYLRRDDRRLFQYRFPMSIVRGVLSAADHQLFNTLVNSPPELRGTQVQSYSPPRGWNADRWYVFVGRRLQRKPISLEGSAVPNDILSLFADAQKLPAEQTWQRNSKDVCFGFCFDPSY